MEFQRFVWVIEANIPMQDAEETRQKEQATNRRSKWQLDTYVSTGEGFVEEQ